MSDTQDTPQAGSADTSTVAVTVPAKHESAVRRLLDLLEKDETWVKDNIEAGLATLENMFKATPTDPTEAQEAASAESANAATESDPPTV